MRKNTLKLWKKISLSVLVIECHVSQGLRYCCLMVIVIVCDTTLQGWNLKKKKTRLKLLDNNLIKEVILNILFITITYPRP